jgi:hypothetical protein
LQSLVKATPNCIGATYLRAHYDTLHPPAKKLSCQHPCMMNSNSGQRCCVPPAGVILACSDRQLLS